MIDGSTQHVELLEWDTELFGFPIGHVPSGRLAPDQLEELRGEARALGLRCVYFRCAADDPASVRAASEGRFFLADVRVTLTAQPVRGRPDRGTRAESIEDGRSEDDGSKSNGSEGDEPGPQGSTSFQIGSVRGEDVPGLVEIAEELSGWSRFAFDPLFGPEQARRLYREWIDVSVAGRADEIVVARVDDRCVGCVTCRLEHGSNHRRGRIELVGVARGAAGQGIGTAMLRRAFQWFSRQATARVDVVTQGRNVAALRFYQRLGFRIREVELLYHGWFDDLAGGSSSATT